MIVLNIHSAVAVKASLKSPFIFFCPANCNQGQYDPISQLLLHAFGAPNEHNTTSIHDVNSTWLEQFIPNPTHP